MMPEYPGHRGKDVGMSADAAAGLEFAFFDFQGFVPWVFRIVLAAALATGAVAWMTTGSGEFLTGLSLILLGAAASCFGAWRAHSARVRFRRPAEGRPELTVDGLRIPLADPAAFRFGLFRDLPRRRSRRLNRPIVRDYVHLVVPCEGGVLILEELLIGAVRYPDLPWIDPAGGRRPRALRSLHPWPGSVARIAAELGLLPAGESTPPGVGVAGGPAQSH